MFKGASLPLNFNDHSNDSCFIFHFETAFQYLSADYAYGLAVVNDGVVLSVDSFDSYLFDFEILT